MSYSEVLKNVTSDVFESIFREETITVLVFALFLGAFITLATDGVSNINRFIENLLVGIFFTVGLLLLLMCSFRLVEIVHKRKTRALGVFLTLFIWTVSLSGGIIYSLYFDMQIVKIISSFWFFMSVIVYQTILLLIVVIGFYELFTLALHYFRAIPRKNQKGAV